MDFRLGSEIDAFRQEVRTFIAGHVTPEMMETIERTGTNFSWPLHREMAKRGWLRADWPPEFGGTNDDPFKVVVLQEELDLVGAPWFGISYARALASCIRHFGTERQKAELIPKLLGGEIIICLGYSEPSCGSDVAAVRTKAVRDGDHWLINGQKMFTTMAEVGTHVFVLTRTNPDAPKHRGLTLFIVPLDAPGIDVHEVKTLGGERTNITYYSDVRVSDEARVGEVDGGWDVMIGALRTERPGGGRDLRDRILLSAVETLRKDSEEPLNDPAVRERLARIAVENEVARLLGYNAVWQFTQAKPSDAAGPMYKLFSSESLVRSSSSLLDILGPTGAVQIGEADALDDGLVEHAFRHSHVTTVYAGTNEIQRDIIAQHGLGLPRRR